MSKIFNVMVAQGPATLYIRRLVELGLKVKGK
jgi:hypothetical protein